MGMDRAHELFVVGGRPRVFVETRRVVKFFLADVHVEALIFAVGSKSLHGNSEKLVAEPQESAEGENDVGDLPLLEVEHDILYFT